MKNTKIYIAALLMSFSLNLTACSLSDNGNQSASDNLKEKTFRPLSNEDAILPFVNDGNWAVISQSNSEKMFISLNDDINDTNHRIIKLKDKDGFYIFRVNVTCPRGGIFVRDLRSSYSDNALPFKSEEIKFDFDVSKDLAEMCKRKNIGFSNYSIKEAVKKLRYINLNNKYNSNNMKVLNEALKIKDIDKVKMGKPINSTGQ